MYEHVHTPIDVIKYHRVIDNFIHGSTQKRLHFCAEKIGTFRIFKRSIISLKNLVLYFVVEI